MSEVFFATSLLPDKDEMKMDEQALCSLLYGGIFEGREEISSDTFLRVRI
ncbi:MAG: hypothetical protein AAGI90_03010 [Chlamydiota bacterium]